MSDVSCIAFRNSRYASNRAGWRAQTFVVLSGAPCWRTSSAMICEITGYSVPSGGGAMRLTSTTSSDSQLDAANADRPAQARGAAARVSLNLS